MPTLAEIAALSPPEEVVSANFDPTSWHLAVRTCREYERLQTLLSIDREKKWLAGDTRAYGSLGGVLVRTHPHADGLVTHVCVLADRCPKGGNVEPGNMEPDFATAGRELFGDQTCPACGTEHPGRPCTAYDGDLLGETC